MAEHDVMKLYEPIGTADAMYELDEANGMQCIFGIHIMPNFKLQYMY